MRPRVFPAEDDGFWSHGRLQLDASMRPRVFPAEDYPLLLSWANRDWLQ